MNKKIILLIMMILSLFISALSMASEKGIKLKEIENNEGRRWAILIGINNYDDKGILDLKKAKNDAVALGEVFEEQGQFDNVYVMTDENDYKGNDYPTYFKIKDRLEYISKFLKPEDLVVFSFSGHGVTINGKSHLVVTDSRIKNLEETTINLEDDVVAMLNKAGVKKSLLLIDACRENFQENKGINKDGLKTKKFEKAEVAATFYATKSGWYSYEDNKSDYGAFTRYVVEGLKGHADKESGNNDGIVSFRELSTYVEDGVFNWALANDKEQAPYTKIYGESYGDLALSLNELKKDNKKKDENIEINEEKMENKENKEADTNKHELDVLNANLKDNNDQKNIINAAEKLYVAKGYVKAMAMLEKLDLNKRETPKKALLIYGKITYEYGMQTGETVYFTKTREALGKFMINEDKNSENSIKAKEVYDKIEKVLRNEDELYGNAKNLGGIDRYLRKYPRGRYAKELRKKMVLLQQNLKKNNMNKKAENNNNFVGDRRPPIGRQPIRKSR